MPAAVHVAPRAVDSYDLCVLPLKLEPQKLGTYEPLGSVWNDEDAELLERMLHFYPRRRPKQIVRRDIERRTVLEGEQSAGDRARHRGDASSAGGRR